MKTGLILEPPKRKDYAFERIFGAADRTEAIKPLRRDVSGIPVVFQGDLPTCVAATITWIRQYLTDIYPDLAHEYLADLAKTGLAGAKPSQVLEPARKVGIVEQETWAEGKKELFIQEAAKYRIAYARLTDLSPHGLYAALKKNPLAIGVNNFRGFGPHFLAAFDVTDDGRSLKCANWHKQHEQDIVEVPFSDVVVAYSILPPDLTLPPSKYRIGFLGMLQGILKFRKEALALLGAIFAGTAVVFGAGYTPITGYESTLTARVDADDTAIPVVSVVDRAGNAIDFAQVSPSSTVRVYFTLEPGSSSREEIIYCTGKSGSSFTPCVRGLSFQGDSLSSSSTLAKIHPPGSKIIISNVGVFYREFVSIDGTQRIDGAKYFATIPRQSSTTTLPTANDQYATKYYVDSVGAGGFTSANVSSSYGIQALGTSPETIGVYASTTASRNGGFLGFASTGRLYWDVVSFLATAWTWAGHQVFTSFNGTSTALTLNYTPTTTTDAVHKSYVDNALYAGYSTGTAGMPITAGQAVYISSTSSLLTTNTAGATSTFRYVGIALENGTTGSPMRFASTGAIACNQSSLDAGFDYYLNSSVANGGVSSTPGFYKTKIGRALSSTCLQLTSPVYSTSSRFATSSIGTVFINTGFYPANVLLMSSPDSAGSGGSISNSAGGMQIGLVGADSSAVTISGDSYVCYDENANATECAGSITSKSKDGFTLNVSNATAAHSVTFTVSSQ